ncbi:MAG: YgiT-type zinc finger protein, partial [Desulfobacterales bacterium]|nr:YgiT-type zinc finger protein [Desulfobacterales bacterium]
RIIGEIMICEFCGGKTTKKKVKRQHWIEGKLYIVGNVEAEVCKECGERYFHATTLDAIDRYLLTEHAVKDYLNVEVVSLG